MRIKSRSVIGIVAAALSAAVAAAACATRSQERAAVATPAPAPPFTVSGEVALYTLMSLGDAHLKKLADILTIVAASPAARSAEWERIRAPLAWRALMTASITA